MFLPRKKMTLNSKEKKYQAKERKEEHPEAYNAACATRMKKLRDNKAATAACVTQKYFHFPSVQSGGKAMKRLENVLPQDNAKHDYLLTKLVEKRGGVSKLFQDYIS